VTTKKEKRSLSISEKTRDSEIVEKFIAETDMNSTTLLIHQSKNLECRKPVRIRWDSTQSLPRDTFDIAIKYAHTEGMDDCQIDKQDHVRSVVIKVPGYISQINSFTWGTMNLSDSRCD
jgi:hypothetical protein